MTVRALLAPLALAAVCFAGPARAQISPPPQGVVNLSASATVEVPQDTMSLALSTHQEADDAATVQRQLKQALDAALGEAKKSARPGEVDVRTGAFNVSPRYAGTGVPSGWQGTAELVLEGRDMVTIGQLAGRITTLTVSRVAYGLSREARVRAEGDLTAQAIDRFKARAADVARLFGYAGYSLREVSVGTADAPSPARPMVMKTLASRAASDSAPLPVEAGRGTITVDVNGSVQLTR